MKRDILVLGVFLLFLGLVFLSVSRISTDPVERWQTVKETEANPPMENLSVRGELADGDRFRAYFTVEVDQALPLPTPMEVGVILMNLTEPSGNIVHLPDTLIAVQQGYPYPLEIPKGVANATGTYQVDAKSVGWVVLGLLRLERFGIETEEPFSFLLPLSPPVIIVGIALSIFGAKSSQRKRRKSRSHKQMSRR